MSELQSSTGLAKLLIEYPTPGPTPNVFIASYNDLKTSGENQLLPYHHTYDGKLVEQLEGKNSAIGLPNPPTKANLPGDCCWQTQVDSTCGPWSFSVAMNYWYPLENNPLEHDGSWYISQIPSFLFFDNGPRTPDDLEKAAGKFNMVGNDHDAEGLPKDDALKIIKLWISAGVPVIVLVEEYHKATSMHWKTLVGYDENRFFFVNTGADDEVIKSKRDTSIEYEKAPIGNDVDHKDHFWKKWTMEDGGFFDGVLNVIIDAFSSVDDCTFIPVYPKNNIFKGEKAG